MVSKKKRDRTSSKPLLTEWRSTPKGNLARYVVDHESAGNVAISTPDGWAVRKNHDAAETIMRDLHQRDPPHVRDRRRVDEK